MVSFQANDRHQFIISPGILENTDYVFNILLLRIVKLANRNE